MELRKIISREADEGSDEGSEGIQVFPSRLTFATFAAVARTLLILLILLILCINAYFAVVSADFFEPENLKVTVDRVAYQPDVDTPLDRPHCFVYFISIHNDTDIPVTIHGRKWVVTNTRGEIIAVEGDGVVGEHPTIEPGEKFSYNSFHLLDTKSAVAEGSYIGVDANGRKVLTRIPKFKMTVPEI